MMDPQIAVSDEWPGMWPARSAELLDPQAQPQGDDFESAMFAIGALVNGIFGALPCTDARALAEDVVGVADQLLDEPRFHQFHRAILSHVRPGAVVAGLAATHGPPTWLLSAVGAGNEVRLRRVDRRMREMIAATMQGLAATLGTDGRGAPDRVQLRKTDGPLWYLTESAIPWQIRNALLAKDRVEVFSAAIMTCDRVELPMPVISAILDAWIVSAETTLAWLTTMPGVSQWEGIAPLDVRAAWDEHNRATAVLNQQAEHRRAMREAN